MSFRREANVPRGGPDGGDGGRGGDVVICAEQNLGSLANIAGHRHWRGGRGVHGRGNLRTGKRGETAIVRVPPGTLVRDAERGHVLKDLAEEGDSVVVARGGKGGRGNKHYATATHRVPHEFEYGEPGEQRTVVLELKLIADVGVIGKPNAGKSTLLSRLSNATPVIADYPFTTKHPNLGLVRVGYEQFVMADIPGLIEGAHQGIGLGHEFLKHIQRTRVLVHLVEPTPLDQTNPVENYHQIREEMRLYDPALVERPEIVCVSKSELPDAAAASELLREEIGRGVLTISSATGRGLAELRHRILDVLNQEDGEQTPAAGRVGFNPRAPTWRVD